MQTIRAEYSQIFLGGGGGGGGGFSYNFYFIFLSIPVFFLKQFI